MKRFLLRLAFFAGMALSPTLHAEDGKSFSVPVQALISATPQPTITLRWMPDSRARGYVVQRKDPRDQSWLDQTMWGTPLAQLPGTATEYIDTAVQKGIAYEYQIIKVCVFDSPQSIDIGQGADSIASYLGSGYITAGIEVPPIISRGKILLLIDSTMAGPLASDLDILEQDLKNELWTVIRKTVSRTEKFDGQAVQNVKAIIREEYDKDPDNMRSVLLLGRVAVPYSGLIVPDGHTTGNIHTGAWPADVFYADMDGTWTDFNVNSEIATRQENKNIPEDGKFDQSEILADIRISVGRVDFYNMPAFKESETELLRRYLRKNHAFRSGSIKPRMAAIIDDNFKGYPEGFSGSAWRSFSPLCGPANILEKDFLTTLSAEPHMFAYGCGAGWYTSCAGVGQTSDFATRTVNSVFTMLFGSYFGDWDSQDNFLRAALASQGSVLSTAWAARPHWFMHSMGLGDALGNSVITAQNNTQQYITTLYRTKRIPNGILYHIGPRSVHTSLLGDPSLRITSNDPIPAPATVATAVPGLGSIVVDWSAVQNVQGYMVYRSDNGGEFRLLTPAPINATTFNDSAVANRPSFGTRVIYQVRAVRLRQTASGSFYEASVPVSSTPFAVSVHEDEQNTAALAQISVKVWPQPAMNHTNIQFDLPVSVSKATVEICSITGNPLYTIYDGSLNAGTHGFVWNCYDQQGNQLSSGVYAVRVKTAISAFTTMISVIR
jgi:hypothetical protein